MFIDYCYMHICHPPPWHRIAFDISPFVPFVCSIVVSSSHTHFMQCVSSCPPQHYRDVLTSASGPIVAGTAVCRSCSEGCLSCSGPTPNQCSQCATLGVRHANGTLECVDTCPVGTYPDAADRLCQSCGTVCECCVRLLTNYCNACVNLRSNSCVSSCSGGPAETAPL